MARATSTSDQAPDGHSVLTLILVGQQKCPVGTGAHAWRRKLHPTPALQFCNFPEGPGPGSPVSNTPCWPHTPPAGGLLGDSAENPRWEA